MTKKDIDGIEHEVIVTFMALENTFKHVKQRIVDMKQYKNSGSIESGEVDKLKTAMESTSEGQEKISTQIHELLKEFFGVEQDSKIGKHSRRDITKEMKLAQENMRNCFRRLQTMQMILDKLEEKFRKYNVPKRSIRRSSPESFDTYLERLREFMQVTWKDAAEICRQKEHRSFIEWMVKLEQSEERQRRTTFKVLRDVLTVIGLQISFSLIQYLLKTAVSAEREEIATSVYEVESIIRCLSVEENSIVIDSFLSVVKLFERAMKLANPHRAKAKKVKRSKKIKNDDDAQIAKENDILSVLTSPANHCPFWDQDTEEKCENNIEIKRDGSQIEKENNVRSFITSLVKVTNGKNKKTTEKVEKDDSQIERENDVLHLIIIEVLRLEVGFRFPDLPMMVSNEVYLAMGEHLMDNVFKDRMKSLSAKMDELKLWEFLSVGEHDSIRKSFERVVDVGVKKIWQNIDLKPRA